jgi:hypothetical protein
LTSATPAAGWLAAHAGHLDRAIAMIDLMIDLGTLANLHSGDSPTA